MSSAKNNKINAIIGTVVFHLFLLVCFVFLGLTYRIPPPPEEGITINFGYDDFGSGAEQPEQIIEENEITQQVVVEKNPVIKEISTQEVEETPFVKERINEKKKLENFEEVEEKKPELVINTKALYPGKKQNNSTNQGIREGSGEQGNEEGDPKSNTYIDGGIGANGVAYNLGGRNIEKIIKPNNDSQQQGKVIVTIRVNRNGKVINATPGAKGSTTTNSYLYSKAKEAALKTTFEANSSAPEIQIGTIIYNFMLN